MLTLWVVNLVGSYAILDTLLLWYNSIWLLFNTERYMLVISVIKSCDKKVT